MSNIRVFVQWKNSTVFAGENIECQITFKNISQCSTTRGNSLLSPELWTSASTRERWKESLASQIPSSQSQSPAAPTPQNHLTNLGAHRSALTLSAQSPRRKDLTGIFSCDAPKEVGVGQQKHKRSVSIVSIGKEPTSSTEADLHSLVLKRPFRGHARAASLQVPTHKTVIQPRHSSRLADATLSGSSYLLRDSIAVAEPLTDFSGMKSEAEILIGATNPHMSLKGSESGSPSFTFPQATATISESIRYAPGEALTRSSSPRPSEYLNGTESLHPVTRILSPISMNGTPRSSLDFYAGSNNSTETLASEYNTKNTRWRSQNGTAGRRSMVFGPLKFENPAETLMMGYGQIAGSFTLDGSLVNKAPFEEVKRKGIIGGQGGGGVVRAEATKREGGLFAGLGWGSIGESLGGLLGSNELSSIKATQDIASMRSIPILSTPQSVLFVDLQLAPGESKSFTYRQRLPNSLPPTHKGRAMKILYNLTIGTQRSAKTTVHHHIRTVNIPFRVLTGVNAQGEILGHDLMAPHILLYNDKSAPENSKISNLQMTTPIRSNVSHDAAPPISDFLSFLEATHNITGQSTGPLSPNDDVTDAVSPGSHTPSKIQNAIEIALLRSNTASSSRTANRFEISRSGERIAIIVVTRPAYRLGEVIFVTIDFQGSEVQCCSLNATLESSELIDTAIALRSKTSIHRATRRIHASESICTLFNRRVTFSPTIPPAATPDFVTSGVSLEWLLRFEFVTSRTKREADSDDERDSLFEEVGRDERNIIYSAVQGIPCESFDVTIPLRVYGARCGIDERSQVENFPI